MNMRQINRRKCHKVIKIYIQGCHELEDSKRRHWAVEVPCHSGAKEEGGVVVWDFKGQEDNSHGEGKANVWYINVCRSTLNYGTQRGL